MHRSWWITIFSFLPPVIVCVVDTGTPSFVELKSGEQELDGAKNGAERIKSIAKTFGVTKIDYLIITHYHGDHVGGVPDLVAQFPVGTFIDHGPNREREIQSLALDSSINRMARDSIAVYPRYLEAIKGHKHIEAKPGDVLHFGSLTDTIVTSDSKVIARPSLRRIVRSMDSLIMPVVTGRGQWRASLCALPGTFPRRSPPCGLILR